MKKLIEIAKKYHSTKSYMKYFDLYEMFLNKYQNSNIKILEIGVFNGDSLKIWREYFSNAIICGFDIDDKKIYIPGVDIFIGDQTDPIFLANLIDKYKNFDIIIDDGSHVSKHIIKSFNFLFNYLNLGGLYVIEDLQTSYFPRYGGSRINLNKKNTSINFIKKLLDSVNYENFDRPFYKKNKYDGLIKSVNMYQNIAFIEKGNSRKFLYKNHNNFFTEKIKKFISKFY